MIAFKGAEKVAKKVAKKWQLKIETQIGSSKSRKKMKIGSSKWQLMN